MVLNANDLSNVVRDAVNNLSESDINDQDKVMRAYWGAFITYFTTYAQVTVTSVSGVTTGGGVSGPGTGTIT